MLEVESNTLDVHTSANRLAIDWFRKEDSGPDIHGEVVESISFNSLQGNLSLQIDFNRPADRRDLHWADALSNPLVSAGLRRLLYVLSESVALPLKGQTSDCFIRLDHLEARQVTNILNVVIDKFDVPRAPMADLVRLAELPPLNTKRSR